MRSSSITLWQPTSARAAGTHCVRTLLWCLLAITLAIAGKLSESNCWAVSVSAADSHTADTASTFEAAGLSTDQQALIYVPPYINDGLLEIGPERTPQRWINLVLFDNRNYESSLLVKGDFQQTESGVLSIRDLSANHRLTPTGPHSTALLVTGEARLAGKLEVGFAEGFLPEVGDRFALVSAKEITGTISTFDQAIIDDQRFLGLNYRREFAGSKPILELITLETPRVVSQAEENRNLLLVTHGTNSIADSWVTDIAEAIGERAQAGWDVVTLDWRDYNGGDADPFIGFFDPVASANNGINIGESLARWYQEQGRTFDNVHLIGHSSGTWLIDALADTLRAKDLAGNIHLTALDAFTPWLGIRQQQAGPLEIGDTADFTDHYFHQHLLVPFTDERLKHAVNVNITESKSFPFSIDGAISSHEFPHDWYLATALDPQNPEIATGGFGARLSAEISGVFPTFHDPIDEGDLIAFQKRFSPTLKAYNLSFRHFFEPINLFEDAQNFITGDGEITSDGSFTGSIESPVILSSLLELETAFSALEFDFSLLSNAPSLLSVYFDGEQVFQLDSSEFTPGEDGDISSGLISLNDIYEPGSYALTFRLDPLSLDQVDFMISDLQFLSWEEITSELNDNMVPEPSSCFSLLLLLTLPFWRRRKQPLK